MRGRLDSRSNCLRPRESLKRQLQFDAFLQRQTQQESRFGMLAQLVEQRTFNPFVVGSTPAHPTKLLDSLLSNLNVALSKLANS